MWLLVGFVLVIFVYVFYLYGVFSPMTLYTDDIQNPLLVYYSHKGSRESIGVQFEKLTSHMQGYFKMSSCFGIYQTPPESPIWETVLGFLVNAGEKSKVADFLKQHPEYKSKQLSSFRYIGSRMPFINMLSFFLLPYKIPKFIAALQQKEYPLFKGIFQLYHFNFNPKTIEFVNPLQNHEQFNLYEEE